MTYAKAVENFHRSLVINTLERHKGHCGKAAIELGIHRNSFTRLARRAGVNPLELRPAKPLPSLKPLVTEATETHRRVRLLAELVCEREGLKKEPFRINRMMDLAERRSAKSVLA